VDDLLRPARATPLLDTLTEQVDAAGTGEIQRRADLARAVGREPDDRHVGRAVDELVEGGRWEKVARGKWQKRLAFGFGVSKDTPNAKLKPTGAAACSCAAPADLTRDGRCSRCSGTPTLRVVT
jgi:hypothetical protein